MGMQDMYVVSKTKPALQEGARDSSENRAGSRIVEADSRHGTEAHLPHSRRRVAQEINIAVYCILGIKYL